MQPTGIFTIKTWRVWPGWVERGPPFKYGPEPLVYLRDLGSVRIPGLPGSPVELIIIPGEIQVGGLSRHYLK